MSWDQLNESNFGNSMAVCYPCHYHSFGRGLGRISRYLTTTKNACKDGNGVWKNGTWSRGSNSGFSEIKFDEKFKQENPKLFETDLTDNNQF